MINPSFVMLNVYKDGRLKMLDARSFNHAPKSKWVKEYLDDKNIEYSPEFTSVFTNFP